MHLVSHLDILTSPCQHLVPSICMQYFLKQFASMFLLLPYWVILGFDITELNSACWGYSMMETLMHNQTGLQNCWQPYSCPKNCIECAPLYRITKTPSHILHNQRLPLSEEKNNSKMYAFYVKAGFYIEISNRRSRLIFISVCIITVRRINCQHTIGEEGGSRRFFFFFGRRKGVILQLSLVLQSASYLKIHSLMSGKKNNSPFYGENMAFNLHHVK